MNWGMGRVDSVKGQTPLHDFDAVRSGLLTNRQGDETEAMMINTQSAHRRFILRINIPKMK